MKRVDRRRGATLLVSIAMLTLLSVFALAFVRLVNFERQASANYTEAVRARMAARAGLARAIAEIRRFAQERHYSDPRKDGWEFRYIEPADDGGRGTNLLTTITPSYSTRDNSKSLFGSILTTSGLAISQSYSGGADVYKLKIIDAASQLNLNHPDYYAIKRMFKNLLRAASKLDDDWDDLDDGAANTLAEAVIGTSPTTQRRFTNITEVRSLLMAAAPATNWEKIWLSQGLDSDPTKQDKAAAPVRPPLRDMLTCSSWVDPTVIRPWNLNGVGVRDLPLMPRSPININTAQVPVLTAVRGIL